MYFDSIRRLGRIKLKQREREILSDYWMNRKVVEGSNISPPQIML